MKPRTALSVCLVGILAALPFASCAKPKHEYKLALETGTKNGVLLATLAGYDSATVTAYVTRDSKRDDTLVPTFSSGNPEVVT
ncbi:MAG: hypothetical protein K2N74_00830, partial [Clostridiales bacterium]|nr:hypothetical protein [Clostridiales bacterium]